MDDLPLGILGSDAMLSPVLGLPSRSMENFLWKEQLEGSNPPDGPHHSCSPCYPPEQPLRAHLELTKVDTSAGHLGTILFTHSRHPGLAWHSGCVLLVAKN